MRFYRESFVPVFTPFFVNIHENRIFHIQTVLLRQKKDLLITIYYLVLKLSLNLHNIKYVMYIRRNAISGLAAIYSIKRRPC